MASFSSKRSVCMANIKNGSRCSYFAVPDPSKLNSSKSKKERILDCLCGKHKNFLDRQLGVILERFQSEQSGIEKPDLVLSMDKLGLGLDTDFKPNNKESSSSLLRNSMSGLPHSRSRRTSTKVPTAMPESEDFYNVSPREQARFATSSSRDSCVKQSSALTIFRRFQKISHSYWLAKGKAEAESWRGDRTRSSSIAENDTMECELLTLGKQMEHLMGLIDELTDTDV